MKPTAALRSFFLGSSLLAAFTSVHAGTTWDGGGADNSSLTAANWTPDGAPNSGTAVLTFGGSVRPAVDWNGINVGVAPINFYGITFAVGASAFTINTGTQTVFQLTNTGSSTVILNNSSNLQTLKPAVHVFFNGTKTIDGSNSGLALDGGIIFRGDSLTAVQSNKLTLTGTANSTTSSIGQLGAYTPGATNSLTKTGSGKWTVTGNATYDGATTISVGTLEFGGSVSSSGITNNSALIFNNAGTQSYANAISGSGTLTKSGLGTFTLSGTNGYAGATSVNGGKLTISAGNINGTSGISIGAGEFNYNSSTALTKAVSFSGTGGTLSGSSTINLAVNVTTGNTLAIGNSNVGVMNFASNLTVAGTYLYELNNTDNTADLGDVAGNLTLSGILDLVQLGAYAAGDKFTLFAYDGTLSGGFAGILDDTNFTDAGGLWTMNYNDTTAGLNGGVSATNKYVTITAIPEPAAALLGGLGLLALLRRRRN